MTESGKPLGYLDLAATDRPRLSHARLRHLAFEITTHDDHMEQVFRFSIDVGTSGLVRPMLPPGSIRSRPGQRRC